MAKYLKTVYLLILLLLANLPVAVCSPAEKAFEDTKITARTEIWKGITAGTAGSATVAVMDSGKLVYAEGIGMADREQSIRAGKDTVFNIGSVSKVFVATSIMLLVDEGKVALDKPVTTYIPEFTMADERYKDITVRMLLNHSSGLPGTTIWNNFGYEYNRNIYTELLASLLQSTLKHRPGELSIYCNDGFTLAEMIVARVSGKSYGNFLTERIFKPLGMNRTGLGVGRLPQGITLAKFYRPDGKSEPLEVVSLIGSGGLSSTAEDLCKFADSFAGRPAILSAKSRAEMLKMQPSEFQGKLRRAGMPFGLGWDYADLAAFPEKDLRVFAKSGGTSHYTAMIYTLPSKRISVAVIATGQRSNAMKIAFTILSAYLTEKGLIAKEEKVIKAPVKVQPIPVDLMAYEGYYCKSTDTLRIALDGEKGKLTMYNVEGGEESILLSAVYNDGYFHNGPAKYYFTTVDGTRYIIQYSFNLDTIMAEKIQPVGRPLQPAVPMAGKQWLRRNVKATEETMVSPTHVITSSQIADLPGYVDFDGLKIIKTPVFASMPAKSLRDITELRLFKRDGATWAWLSGAVYMPAELAMPLSAGINIRAIGHEGYNEWLKAGFDSILQFEVPPKGRIIVFGPEDVLYDSVINSGNIFAPAGSLIEVAGNPGDIFKVTGTALD
jgi:CubicO group peptidase (beta-lactamase class C family)